MKDADELRQIYFFKIVMFVTDIAVDVLRKFIRHKLNGQAMHEFLEINKHTIYHKWIYNVPCCSASCEFEASPLVRPKLSWSHVESMFNINGPEKDGHEQKENGRYIQHCICKVSIKQGFHMGVLDLTTCYRILTGCFSLTPQEKKWVKCIIYQRNDINKYIEEKKLDPSTFVEIWEQLEIPCMLIAAEVKSAYSDEIYGRIKVLAKTTPIIKKYMRSYEKYLEWFSRDDILKKEIKKAKQSTDLKPRNDLIITEVITLDLTSKPDVITTAVACLPKEQMEEQEKDDNHNKQLKECGVFTRPVIVGANAPHNFRQHQPIVKEVGHAGPGDHNEEKMSSSGTKVFSKLQNPDSNPETEIVCKPSKDIQKTNQDEPGSKVFQTVISVKIPGKIRQKGLTKVEDEYQSIIVESIAIKSFKMDPRNITISADMTEPAFASRQALISTLTDLLLKIFRKCHVSDTFAVDVTIEISKPDNIDSSCFNVRESTEIRKSRKEKSSLDTKHIEKSVSDTKQVQTTASNTKDAENLVLDTKQRQKTFTKSTEDKPKECAACRIREIEIQNLQKQVKLVKAQPQKCKECERKDNIIFTMEQDKVRMEHERLQRESMISSLQTDVASKDDIITSYTKLERLHSVIDKYSGDGTISKERRCHLNRHSSAYFYSRPSSEPLDVITRLPKLKQTNGQHSHIERPISEHVLQKPKYPAMSSTQKTYLTSIRRSKDFIPLKQLAVLRYSFSDSRYRRPHHIPEFPPLFPLITSSKRYQRPLSVTGKPVERVAVEPIRPVSRRAESGKRARIVCHLPRVQ